MVRSFANRTFQLRSTRKQEAESATLERLLHLSFPAVVRVSGDRIVPTDEFVSLFGNVESLKQLPTTSESESDATDLDYVFLTLS